MERTLAYKAMQSSVLLLLTCSVRTMMNATWRHSGDFVWLGRSQAAADVASVMLPIQTLLQRQRRPAVGAQLSGVARIALQTETPQQQGREHSWLLSLALPASQMRLEGQVTSLLNKGLAVKHRKVKECWIQPYTIHYSLDCNEDSHKKETTRRWVDI